MSTTTSIEWADKTWSPLLGCERVSPGCDACYAISASHIRAGNPNPKIATAFEGLTHRINGRTDWTGRINLLPDRLGDPLRWRKPAKVFVNSQADLFHEDVPAEFIARVFAVMAKTPKHTYQILTKRHGRMRSLMGDDGQRLLEATVDEETAQALYDVGWPLPNVWLGVSVENQQWADIRIPALLDTPAAVRWISAEPLLGPVDLRLIEQVDGCTCAGGIAESSYLHEPHCGTEPGAAWGRLHWVVAGGESGHGARPMHPDWARSLRDQCVEAGVPYLFKQWGEWAPHRSGIKPGAEIRAYPGAMLQRVGKKAAGRELDGRVWDQYPESRAAVAA